MPSNPRHLLFERLDHRVLLAVTVAESEPNDSRGSADEFVLTDTATLTGVSQTDDDKDFFSFVSPVSQRISLRVESVNRAPAQLQLEDQAGNSIFETDPNDGIYSGSVQLTAGARYFIRMRGRDDVAAEYRTHVSLPGQDPGPVAPPTGRIAEIEENDEKSIANPFNLDPEGTAQLVGTSINEDDKDFFTFVPAKSAVLFVLVDSPNGNPAQLEIEDRLGQRIMETEHGAFTTSDLVAIMQAGLYRTDRPATFAQGDWSGDGRFDEQDLILAFQAGSCRQ